VLYEINTTKNFNADAIIEILQRGQPLVQKRHTTYRLLRLVHHFLHSSPFYPTPKIQCFSISQTFPKVALTMAASTSHAIHVPWTHSTQPTKLHLDPFSCFLHSSWRTAAYTVMCAKTRLSRNFKNYSFDRPIINRCQLPDMLNDST